MGFLALKLEVLNKILTFKQNSNKLMDLVFRKGGSSAPREPPWLRAWKCYNGG